MFCEKLNILFLRLGCTNNEFSEYTGYDCTSISRFRNGKRLPGQKGKAVSKLVEGIYDYSIEHGLLVEVCDAVGIDASQNRKDTEKALVKWLFEDDEGLPIADNIADRFGFSQRLTSLLDFLDMSNASLACAVGVDASHISRFVNARRVPKQNGRIVTAISRVFIERAKESGLLPELEVETGLALNKGSDSVYDLCNWLYYGETTKNKTTVHNLLMNFGDMPMIIPSADEDYTSESVKEPVTTYIGKNGLRRAITRFFSEVIKDRDAEVFLYTDETLKWLLFDNLFSDLWFSFIRTALNNGAKITVVHQFDRTTEELMVYLERWMPLYIMGNLKPYVSKNAVSGDFEHMLLLHKNHASVTGFMARSDPGTEVYNYNSAIPFVKAVENTANTLLENSLPLISIYTYENNDAFCEMINSQVNNPGRFALALNTLPLGTMQTELLLEICNRCKLSQADTDRVLAARDTSSKAFEHAIFGDGLLGISALSSPKEVFAGGVRVDMDELLCGTPLFYTPDEYMRHLKTTISASSKYKKQKLCFVSSTDYHNIEFFVKGDIAVIMRTKQPFTAVSILDTNLAKRFGEHADSLYNIVLENHRLSDNALANYTRRLERLVKGI